MGRNRRRLKTLLAAGVIASAAAPAAASGGGEPAPWYLDQFGGDRAALQRLYDGRPGIVMARSPRPMLFIAWRGLHGLKTGRTAGESLSVPCCDVAFPAPEIKPPAGVDAGLHGRDAWDAARKLVPGAPEKAGYLSLERDGPNYTSTPNCYPEALETAATTLRARVAAHGAGAPAVRAWLEAQDVVFDACAKPGLALPPLPADAPAWLRADRAYQTAALDLYDGRWAQAADGFAAIGRDRGSPWRASAAYLVVRARMRAALAQKTPEAFTAARRALANLAAAPAGWFGRGDVRGLSRVLDFRERPDALAAELDRALAAPTLREDAAVAFKDLDLLGGRVRAKPEVIDWLDTLLPTITDAQRKAGERPREAFDAAETRLQREATAAALTHARARWTAGRNPAWLLAAISLVDPGAAEADALVADAERVAPAHPAWLTLQHHVVRLTLASAPAAANRARLDRILAREDLTPGDRNVFTAARAQVAVDAAEFVRLSLRRRLCVGEDEATGCLRHVWLADSYAQGGIYDGVGDKGAAGLGEDARAVVDRLPLAVRIAVSRDPALPAKLRLDVALTSYARAIQLQDWPAVDGLARDLTSLLPQLASDWRAITAAKPGADKRFAAFLPLAKIPGVRVDLVDYVRPEGAVSEFQQYWTDWLILARPAPGAVPPPLAAYQQAGFGVARDAADARTDLTCLGECGRGAAPLHLPDFAAASQRRASAERRFLIETAAGTEETPTAPLAPGAVAVWNEMLAYAEAHPHDPRVPEALYWLNRIGRFGGSHDHSGRRAFRLLHARHPASSWAKKSLYFYD